MSDYSKFCESYGGSASDPDFMDSWLDKYASETKSKINHISIEFERQLKLEYEVSDKAWDQVIKYVSIFRASSFNKHHQVNEHITKNGLWDDFREIRSMNNHGANKTVHGITPKYFKLVCNILEITGGGGDPLIKSEKY
ncbi:hypothetical protein [Pseudomonas extremaustralis]